MDLKFSPRERALYEADAEKEIARKLLLLSAHEGHSIVETAEDLTIHHSIQRILRNMVLHSDCGTL